MGKQVSEGASTPPRNHWQRASQRLLEPHAGISIVQKPGEARIDASAALRASSLTEAPEQVIPLTRLVKRWVSRPSQSKSNAPQPLTVVKNAV